MSGGLRVAELIGYRAGTEGLGRIDGRATCLFSHFFSVAVTAVWTSLIFDTQIPPQRPLSTDLPQLQPNSCAVALPNWLVSNRIVYTGRTAQSFPRVAYRKCEVQRSRRRTSMFVSLWSTKSKPGSEERFGERLWPGWRRLGQALPERPHYAMTRLLRDDIVLRLTSTSDIWNFARSLTNSSWPSQRTSTKCETRAGKSWTRRSAGSAGTSWLRRELASLIVSGVVGRC